MRRFLVIIIMYVVSGVSLNSSYAFNDISSVQVADYLKLTRENIPSPREVVSETYANLDFNLMGFKERIERVHLSALLPENVNLSYGYAPDGLSRYGYYNRSTTSTNLSNSYYNNSFQTQHGVIPNQYDTKNSYAFSMRWDLQKLFGVDGEIFNTLAEVIHQVDQEGFALGQIARSYGQLISALPETSDEILTESQVLVIYEHAGILDSLSGGLLSKSLSNSSYNDVKVIDNTTDNIDSYNANKSDLIKSGNIIEVRDGQDDGIEVIGGASN